MKTITLHEKKASYILKMKAGVFEEQTFILNQAGEPMAVILPMRTYESLAKVEVNLPAIKANQNREAFLEMHEQLLQTYEGQFVAFKNGQFIDHDVQEQPLVQRLYDRFGMVSLYIKKVQHTEQVYRLPSPRYA